jgi:hypothetical protein
MSRNASTEVTVLRTSCQVSTLWNSQIVGTQTATRIAEIVKKAASLTKREAVSAKRSKRVRSSPMREGRSAIAHPTAVDRERHARRLPGDPG